MRVSLFMDPEPAAMARARALGADRVELFTEPYARAFHTPRRLVLRGEVPLRQPDREEPVWGPSLKAAKDAAGKWTGAAQGFARKNAVALEDLAEGAKDQAKPGGLYLLHVRKVAGRPTIEVLPGLLASVLRGLAFPKRMSWDAWLDDGRGAFPFGRPIRWLVFLLDGEVVPFTIHALVDGARGPATWRAVAGRGDTGSCRRAGARDMATIDTMLGVLRRRNSLPSRSVPRRAVVS